MAIDDDRELDLAAALGAEREVSTQVLSLYIPNKDRHGRPIRTAPWIREAQEILTRIGEGYTTTPPHDVVVAELSGAEGSWLFRIKDYDE